MNKPKKSNAILAVTLILSLLFFLQGIFNIFSFAIEDDEEWNVKITADTKDGTSKETKEIKFEIQDNPYVAEGKLAPGSIATAKLNLDLTGNKYPVEFMLDIEEDIPSNFRLTAKINNEDYEIGKTRILNTREQNEKCKTNGNNEIILTLEWIEENNMDNLDTLLGANGRNIILPIYWIVKQK